MNKQQLPHLEITYRPLHSLILNTSNPRKHTASQIKQIAKSIESFGFNVPVLIDGQNQLLCGHGRVQAAG